MRSPWVATLGQETTARLVTALLAGAVLLSGLAPGHLPVAHDPLPAPVATGVPPALAPTSPPSGGPAPSAGPAPSGDPLPSQVNEWGTLAGVARAGPEPYYPGFDPSNGYLYVPNVASNTVTVINGTTPIANVTVPGGLTAAPYTAAYDPSNGEMYVTDDYSGYVTIINGTKAVTSIVVPNNPIAIAYDPQNGYMYVGEEGSYTAAILNGTGVVTTVSLTGYPWGVVYDPADGWMYFADASVVDVVNGTHRVASIAAVGAAYGPGIAYDPVNQEVYVADDLGSTVQCLRGNATVGSFYVWDPGSLAFDTATSNLYAAQISNFSGQLVSTVGVFSGTTLEATLLPDQGNASSGVHGVLYQPQSATVYVAAGSQNVSVFSTVLGLQPINVTPSGNPSLSADVGQGRNISADLWAVGNGTLTPSIAISPRNEWSCGPLGWTTSRFGPDRLNMTCTPEVAGSFALWANVTDASGARASSGALVTVFASPTVHPLEPQVNGRWVTGADANAIFDVWVNVTGGSANLSYGIEWSPSGDGVCVNFLANHFQCAFAVVELVDLQAYATDGNGESGSTPILAFSIVSDMAASAVVAAPPSADAGQSVQLEAAASGGTGVYDSYAWTGLPAGACQSASTAAPVCVFPTPGQYPVQVVIGDSGGGTATSATLQFQVDPMLQLPTLVGSRASVDVGQTMTFSAAASGGSPPYIFAWTGLPDGCPAAPAAARVNCSAVAPGSTAVQVVVTDANGESLASNLSGLTVFANLTVGAPSATPASGTLGENLSIESVVVGGAPILGYSWLGLPPGCASSTARVVCAPTAAGTYSVRVSVTDSDGVRMVSPALPLHVGPRPGSAGGPRTFPLDAAAAAALAAVAAIAVVVGLLRRRRGR